MEQAWIIGSALFLDVLIGDPLWLPHPVRWMGFFINKLEIFFRRNFINLRLAGFLLWLIMVGGTLFLSYTVLIISFKIHWIFGLMVNIVMIFYALAIKSLTAEGRIISGHLKSGDLAGARKRLQTVVSRDCSSEDQRGIIRGAIETLTENLSDGIIAPLLFAASGGGPWALAYKAVNTLDSMVGYKNEKYKDFGWFSARADDAVNLIPARLTGILIVLCSVFFFHHPLKAVRAWLRDSQKGPSPNGGIPIVTFAGARDMALGGDCYAPDGSVINSPVVGGSGRPPDLKDMGWANVYIHGAVFLFFCVYILVKNF